MNVGRKIYYELATGNVILDTGERSGDVKETTIDDDFSTFLVLAGRVKDSVGCLQLEYGQYRGDFLVGGIITRVDPDTEEVFFTYPEPEEQEPTPPQKPLTEQVEELKIKLAESNESNLLALDALAATFEMTLDLQDMTVTLQAEIETLKNGTGE